MDFDLVALFQFERVDHGGGKADRQTVAPFRDLHRFSPWIYVSDNVYLAETGIKRPRLAIPLWFPPRRGFLACDRVCRCTTVLWRDPYSGNRCRREFDAALRLYPTWRDTQDHQPALCEQEGTGCLSCDAPGLRSTRRSCWPSWLRGLGPPTKRSRRRRPRMGMRGPTRSWRVRSRYIRRRRRTRFVPSGRGRGVGRP